MTYDSPRALRIALEHRLAATSQETGVALDRLRRRVLFERILARVEAAEPGVWVLKGGMALEVRLNAAARVTKDIDLGLRDVVNQSTDLQERLVDALSRDPFSDRFVFGVGKPDALREDGAGYITWRLTIKADLAGKVFGSIKVDVSPRAYELVATERLVMPNALAFAGFPAIDVEVVDLHRHAAEKFHAMTRDFGQRENSRFRDLLDLVLLIENGLLDPAQVAAAARTVWAERDSAAPPSVLPPFPESWPMRYEQLADGHDIEARTFTQATATVERLWNQMFSMNRSSSGSEA